MPIVLKVQADTAPAALDIEKLKREIIHDLTEAGNQGGKAIGQGVQKGAKEAEGALAKLSKALDVSRITGGIDAVGDAYQRLSPFISTATEEQRKLVEQTFDAAKATAELGGAIAGPLGAAVGGVFGAAVVQSKEFQDLLRTLVADVGPLADELTNVLGGAISGLVSVVRGLRTEIQDTFGIVLGGTYKGVGRGRGRGGKGFGVGSIGTDEGISAENLEGLTPEEREALGKAKKKRDDKAPLGQKPKKKTGKSAAEIAREEVEEAARLDGEMRDRIRAADAKWEAEQEKLRADEEAANEAFRQGILDADKRWNDARAEEFLAGVEEYRAIMKTLIAPLSELEMAALAIGDAFKESFQDVAVDAFDHFLEGLSDSEKGLKGLGKAIKGSIGEALKSLAKQFFVKGLGETAEGIAALASGPFQAPRAMQHFAAAGAFFSAAAAAGVGGALASRGGRGGGGGGGGGAGGSSGGSSGLGRGSDGDTRQLGTVVINYYAGGEAGSTTYHLDGSANGRAAVDLANALEGVMGRGRRGGGRLN